MTQQTIDRPSVAAADAGVADRPNAFFRDETVRNQVKEASKGCRNTGIHHAGLHATNPAASAEFYRDILGMEIVGGSAPDHPFGATAFLSSRPNEESHEIALFANPLSPTSPSRSLHSPSFDPSTRVLWRRISRSSSYSTTASLLPSISTTLTAT